MIQKRRTSSIAAFLLTTAAIPALALSAPGAAAAETSTPSELIRALVAQSGVIPSGVIGAGMAEFGAQTGPGRSMTEVAQASRAVRAAQERLNALGYSAGPADGLMGARTRTAIQAYQNDEGLLVTGQVSQSLLDHITATLNARTEAQAEERAEAREEERDTTAGANGDRSLITNIQSELRRRDYDIPAVSGDMDSATRDAIRAYERDRGYLVTGRATGELLEDLRANRQDETAEDDRIESVRAVAAVQSALNSRGYDAGPADGVMGPRTRTAIRTYQSDAGLTLTGRVDSELLARLDLTDAVSPQDDDTASEPDTGPDNGDSQLTTLLSEDFSDGDYTSAPRWRIADGNFEISNGGLRSVVGQQQSQSLEDAGLQLLGSVLERELGFRIPAEGGQASVAAASVPVDISNSFRITTEISGRDFRDGQINIGPYRGDQLGQGYRLAYFAGDNAPLVLLRIDGGNQTVLDSSSFSLSDGQTVQVDWHRQVGGQMTVVANGNVVLQATDTSVTGGFDGFSLINAGGDWTLSRVSVQGMR